MAGELGRFRFDDNELEPYDRIGLPGWYLSGEQFGRFYTSTSLQSFRQRHPREDYSLTTSQTAVRHETVEQSELNMDFVVSCKQDI